MFIDFVELVKKEISDGGKIAVHCRMGNGRTGTMLAALLMQTEEISANEVLL